MNWLVPIGFLAVLALGLAMGGSTICIGSGSCLQGARITVDLALP